MMKLIVLLGAIYNLMIAFSMKTENMQSSLLFKFLPFILGLGGVLYYLHLIGFLTMGSN